MLHYETITYFCKKYKKRSFSVLKMKKGFEKEIKLQQL